MDETETNSMCIEAYHAATRLHTVDILAGIMPRLRVNPAKQQSEPKPLSLRTRKRMTREICTVYRLFTDVHPKLESSALGCIRTDDNGDMY